MLMLPEANYCKYVNDILYARIQSKYFLLYHCLNVIGY